MQRGSQPLRHDDVVKNAAPDFGLHDGVSGMENMLAEASARGVVQVKLSCSLVGGYSETGPRQHWSAVAEKRATGKNMGVARGHTPEEAIRGALVNVGGAD